MPPFTHEQSWFYPRWHLSRICGKPHSWGIISDLLAQTPPLNQVSFTNYVTPIPEELDGASATPILCAVGIHTVTIVCYTHTVVGIDRLQSPQADWADRWSMGCYFWSRGRAWSFRWRRSIFIPRISFDIPSVLLLAVQYAISMGLRVVAIGKFSLNRRMSV